MAVNVESVRPYRSDWRSGHFTSWLTTVDHKRIGLLYIWTSLFFFAIGCVRMRNSGVVELFDLVPAGTRVEIA